MFSSKVIAVRSTVAATAADSAGPQHLASSRSIDSRSCCLHPRSCNHHHPRLWCRAMSSNSSNCVEPDFVRMAVQKMIMDQQQQQAENSGGGGGEISQPSTLSASMDRNAQTTMNGSMKPTPTTPFPMIDNSDLEKALQSLQVCRHDYFI